MRTVIENRDLFLKLKQTYEEQYMRREKLFSLISTLRLLVFLFGAVGLILGITEKKSYFIAAGCLLLAGFVVLVKIHSIVEREQNLYHSKTQICERYAYRYKDKWHTFRETGREYMCEGDCVAEDIDLLGENSLYQMISVCHTEKGKQLLAQRLTERFVEPRERLRRAEAIAELAGNPEFAVDFETAGMEMERKKNRFQADEFESFCADPSQGRMHAWMHVVRIAFPACEIMSLVLFLCGLCSYWYPMTGFFVLLALAWVTKGRTDAVTLPAYAASAVSDDYEKMLALLKGQPFACGKLKEIRQSAEGAFAAYQKLKPVRQAYNVSYNPMIHFFLSGLFLWDYQIAAIVSKWKRTYGAKIVGCSGLIAEAEELMSFSVLAMVRKTGKAEVEETGKTVMLCGENLCHPLLIPDQVQGNSVTLAGGITIITGSNMSGKTTFLRTLAVNLVLAYLGAPVCADYLKATYMKIFTSMRVKDDVAHGISTFYAEILRIKSMADYRAGEQPMICLIDEIFKGTNSADRIVGAKEVITKLAGAVCMTVVSTHDFELCSITDSSQTPAVNYHFQEYYDGDELRFDYKIRDGRCTTTNARAILRMAGFEVS